MLYESTLAMPCDIQQGIILSYVSFFNIYIHLIYNQVNEILQTIKIVRD